MCHKQNDTGLEYDNFKIQECENSRYLTIYCLREKNYLLLMIFFPQQLMRYLEILCLSIRR